MTWLQVLAALVEAIRTIWRKYGDTLSGMALGATAATAKGRLDAAEKSAAQTDRASATRQANAALSQPAAADQLRGVYRARRRKL